MLNISRFTQWSGKTWQKFEFLDFFKKEFRFRKEKFSSNTDTEIGPSVVHNIQGLNISMGTQTKMLLTDHLSNMGL